MQIPAHLAMEHFCCLMEPAALIALRATIWTLPLADASSVLYHALHVLLVPTAQAVNLPLCSQVPPASATAQQGLTTTLPLLAAPIAHFPTVAIALLPAAALACPTTSRPILLECWLDATHIAYLVSTQIQFP